jgi:hypothetical protein
VANYYYEVSDSLIDAWDSKYYVVTSRSGDAMMAGGLTLTMQSDRIWREDNSSVRFVKNRYNIDYSQVDMQEFMWIKLSSKVINHHV